MSTLSNSIPKFCSSIHEYKPIRFRPVDENGLFDDFLDWMRGIPSSRCKSTDYAIQFIQYPNFKSDESTARSVRMFHHKPGVVEFYEINKTAAGDDRFVKGNAFRNFTCKCASCGEGRGIFIELNLYVPESDAAKWASPHHTSTTHGAKFERNTMDDNGSVRTKGEHWLFPDGPSM